MSGFSGHKNRPFYLKNFCLKIKAFLIVPRQNRMEHVLKVSENQLIGVM